MPNVVFDEEYNAKDFILETGDLIYNLDRNEFFQIYKLQDNIKNTFIILNLARNVFYEPFDTNDNGTITFSQAVETINFKLNIDDSIKFKHIKSNDYDLNIVAKK